MGPHERKLDANDSTVGSELRERKKKIPVIDEPRTRKHFLLLLSFGVSCRACCWAGLDGQTAEYFDVSCFVFLHIFFVSGAPQALESATSAPVLISQGDETML
jgi:hypothetical protein